MSDHHGSALDLLSGDAQTFHHKVWASRVHVHHTDPADLVDLLSLDDVDRLLTSSALRTPALRLAQDGAVISPAKFTRHATMAGTAVTGLVDGRKVLDLFVEPEPDRVVDLDGPAREVLLEPGLSMYLPTGTPHSARSQEVTSLHVTLGINRVSMRELLRSLVNETLGDERYDAPLPSGWLDDPSRLASALGGPLDSLASSLSALGPSSVAAARADRFLSDRSPALEGGLVDRVALPELSDATRLERRPTAACVLRPGEDRLTVHLGDRSLRMPARLTPVLEFVRDTPSFTVAELERGLYASSRLVVARRLVREGLLRIVP